MTVTVEDYSDLVNARWRVWYAGNWRPITHMYSGGRPVYDPLMAGVAVVFCGSDIPDGDWLTIERPALGQIYSREPSRAIPGISWHQGARLWQALHGAPEARETAF